MKTIGKIIIAGVILLVIAAAGCAALIGAGANEAAKAIDKSQRQDTAAARAFEPKFRQVKVGDSLTGAGGMSKAQVATLLGKPKPGDTTTSHSQGMTLVTWSYSYIMADKSTSMIFSVDFINGHVSGKSRL